ncbi:DUF3422 family protein [Vogesella oryzae]|uniref:DUF3422 family protein n=1 Tax=Vogesella oryzae TaxID=1735285 RepID=UPI0015825FB0|nr:DUF3422 domain-containing protein [Vogesella oryzae]
MITLKTHPLRRSLNDEAHARPPVAIPSPARLTTLTLFFDEAEAEQRAAMHDLANRLGLPLPDAGQVHYTGVAGDLTVRWALHTEFARYSFVLSGDFVEPFDRTALDRLPGDWLNQLPGELMVATHAVLLPAEQEAPAAEIAQRWFGGHDLIGAEIGDGNGVAYTDLRLHPDPRLAEGFSRFVLIDRDMGPSQSGRMVQRLFEMETYRLLALLALPEAKRQMRELDRLGTLLRRVTQRMAQPQGHDAGMLDELTDLSAQAEQLIAQSQYRFAAARAYYQLVGRRIGELRERRLSGLQPFHEFMERRLGPAMETCATAVRRQERLMTRLQRSTALLRTRVEVVHEEQNRALLASMDRRAALQLRLQETVEGLSVGVLTYYAVSLLGYLFKAVKAAGLHLNVELLTGLSIPAVAFSVWLGMRRVKRGLQH